MSTSIRTIAKVAETSVSSVSRVLNNSGYVSPDVRQRVETAIKDLNYAPSKGARMLRGEASRMIGLMLPSIDVPFFGILANTIERELFERGYHTLICSSAENEDHEARYVAMLRAQRVEGVIVASAYGGTAHLQPLVDSGIPIIAIDRELVGISDDVFMADHAEGAASDRSWPPSDCRGGGSGAQSADSTSSRRRSRSLAPTGAPAGI